ncbi:MAG TPA: hypothetical protein ENK57_11080 [Polyangiaceae bacterium]|nr:hypothetical protein [Polyangiaceae bacterium]
MSRRGTVWICGAAIALASCEECGSPPPSSLAPASPAGDAPSAATSSTRASLLDSRLLNPAPYIPAQCYTQTRDEDGTVHNPCFTCHTRPQSPSSVDDQQLQRSYDFPAPALENRWSSLFVDRRRQVAAISDDEILTYVRVSNYRLGDRLLLAEALSPLPAEWDVDGDGRWGGYVPDAYFRFDDAGFDRDPKGAPTGWRAYAYYPFPGVFFPTNGSAGDVLIRLAPEYRQRDDGGYDQTVYRVNLAIVESLIKRRDVVIEPTDEQALGVDLDGDGEEGRAIKVAFADDASGMSYVGRARLAQQAGEIRIEPGLFPRGTELLHSVRYLDVVDGGVVMAARFKELRYARKAAWVGAAKLAKLTEAEALEERDYPDRLEKVMGEPEHGLSNGQGWLYQGFIEDAAGALRPQTFEESAFCMGCHGRIGATTDGIFSFPRKLDASSPSAGWFHWSQHGLRGLPEPRGPEGRYEYTFYLEQNGAGDDLRDNTEVIDRFFEDGVLRASAVERLHGDMAELLLPSPRRALALNKAYRTIVQAQSFVEGRDATIEPARRVHRRVERGQPTGITEPVVAPLAPTR